MTDTNNTVLTDDQWVDLAQRHANSDWNSDQPDGYLNAVKALCQDFLSILPAASEAGAVPVYYRYRHSANEKWHYGPTPQSWWECKALYAAPPAQPQDAGAVPVARIQGRHGIVFTDEGLDAKLPSGTLLYAAPAAQPEKQAAQDDAVELLKKFMDYRDADYVPNGLFERASKIIEDAPPAPSQQAAPAAEPDTRSAAEIMRAFDVGLDKIFSPLPPLAGKGAHWTDAGTPAAESAEPATGGTVSELLDAIRHYGSEKWSEGNRHAIAVGDDRKSIRAAWDDVYRLVQLLATQPTAATADAQQCVGCEGKPSGDNVPCAVCGATADAQGDELIEKIISENPYTNYSYVAQNAKVEKSRAEKHARTLMREALSRQPTQQDAQGDERAIVLQALSAAKRFIRNGVEFGYIRMPDSDCPDPAHQTPILIDRAIAALSRQPSAAASAGELSDDQCIAVYQALDEFGRNVDHYEYGLPMLGVDDRQTEALQTIRTAIEDARAQRAAAMGSNIKPELDDADE